MKKFKIAFCLAIVTIFSFTILSGCSKSNSSIDVDKFYRKLGYCKVEVDENLKIVEQSNIIEKENNTCWVKENTNVTITKNESNQNKIFGAIANENSIDFEDNQFEMKIDKDTKISVDNSYKIVGIGMYFTGNKNAEEINFKQNENYLKNATTCDENSISCEDKNLFYFYNKTKFKNSIFNNINLIANCNYNSSTNSKTNTVNLEVEIPFDTEEIYPILIYENSFNKIVYEKYCSSKSYSENFEIKISEYLIIKITPSFDISTKII